MNDRFTKTETLRRLRACAGLARRVEGLSRSAPAEVGLRTNPVRMAEFNIEDAFHEDDDLANFARFDEASRTATVAEHGSVVHIYVYTIAPPSDPYSSELVNTFTFWMGTPTEEPRVVSAPGFRTLDGEVVV